jgi:TM2 domain-containing membrane protein YozV
MSMHVFVDNTHRAPRFGVVVLLWLLGVCGLCGLHRLYCKRWKSGLFYLATFGVLGLGQLLDWFRLGSMVRAAHRPPVSVRRR